MVGEPPSVDASHRQLSEPPATGTSWPEGTTLAGCPKSSPTSSAVSNRQAGDSFAAPPPAAASVVPLAALVVVPPVSAASSSPPPPPLHAASARDATSATHAALTGAGTPRRARARRSRGRARRP